MISPQTIQQITSRIDIIDVIGDFVKLKKRGANYLGNCPFHNEKTPSFTVSPTKEIYKCFGCGKSGNTISFLMEHEKQSYVEALRWLAHRYNVEIEETVVSDEVRQQQLQADSLYIINNFAQKFFSQQLLESEEGKAVALSYLEERGFNDAIISKFQVGYCPAGGKAFATAALAQQFNKELLVKSGLVIDRNGELFDNYRGRIIFPIHGITGKIIGFGARVIGKADKAPKYINTPENDIYVKSKILYGSYFARHTIDKENECLLVEGYTDVTSLHQAGIENVVASGGTSLTIDQLRLIHKYTNNLTILYDGDAAGVKAALRGLDMALEEGLNVKVVLIPNNEDPDSYVNKVGAKAFKEFLRSTRKDFILFQLEVMLKDAGDDVSKKSEVVNHIAESLSKINKPEDFIKQQEYTKQSAALLKIDEAALVNLVNKYKRDKVTKDEQKALQQQEQATLSNKLVYEDEIFTANDEQHERNVMRVLVEYGLKPWDEDHTIADFIFSELEDFSFDNPQYDKLYTLYHHQYVNGNEPDGKTLAYHEDPEIRGLIANLTMAPYELSHKWDEVLENMNILNRDTSRQDAFKSISYFKLRKIKKMFEQNQKEIQESKNPDELTRLLKVYCRLKEIEVEVTKNLGTVILK